MSWFSIVADEATDVTNKEQLVICIRWVDNDFQIHEDPVELINVPKTDAKTLTGAIKDCLIRLSLPLAQCRGQAYDGASNMSGHLNGVAAQIQKDVPSALFVHCLAHCINLTLQPIGRQCVPVRDALDLIIEVTQLIRYSPKRSALFQSLQTQLNPEVSSKPTSLKPLCLTRWTVCTSAFNSILTNYTVLCQTLETVNTDCNDEYGRKAGGCLAKLEKFSTFFGIKLSYLVFSGIEQLSLSIQGKNTTLQDATNAAELAICFLQRQRTDEAFTTFYSQVVAEAKDLTDPPVLPRYRNPPKRLDGGSISHQFNSPKEYFRKQYFEVLDLLINELQRRFQQERGMPMAVLIEKLLLEYSNASSSSKSLPTELDIYKNDIDLSKLNFQLQMLPDLIKSRNQQVSNSPIKEVTNVKTIATMMNELPVCKTMFSEISRLLQIFFTIPVTTSTAERTFSLLRRLKTFLRSTMTQPRLNNLMMLYVHREKTSKLDMNGIAETFVNVNDRRRQYFGSF